MPAQRPDEQQQARPADEHLFRARTGDEQIFQQVAQLQLRRRNAHGVAGAVDIIDAGGEHEHACHGDHDDRNEPAELHRTVERIAKIAAESARAPLFSALADVGKDGALRARLLIGVHQKIGKSEQSDGNELHDLDAAVEVDLDHVGKLGKGARCQEGAAKRHQHGKKSGPDTAAEEPDEADLRLVSSLPGKHAAKSRARERRHHDAARHGKKQRIASRLEESQREHAEHAGKQQPKAPFAAQAKQQVKQHHKQRRHAEPL